MITLQEGSERMLPYVAVDITTGRFPFYYWYEVHTWDAEEKVWYHHIDKDGGCFLLWRTVRKCKDILSDTWLEELDAMMPRGRGKGLWTDPTGLVRNLK